MLEHPDSFRSRARLNVGGRSFELFRIDALARASIADLDHLPFSIKVLLENLLRNEDGACVAADDVTALAAWRPDAPREREIAFRPARVLLQDFTGVPCVVDLAAMRHAMRARGHDPRRINPLQPVDLVIDHSVQVDSFGSTRSFTINGEQERKRNRERYELLRWAQEAFDNLRVVPPDNGIVHQVNLEYLAQVVCERGVNGSVLAYPDTLVGTDSHTTMVNGLGVLGWGVGGIEAEAAMLGQPASLLVPDVVGVRLVGHLRAGVTATDVVLTITEMLRVRGVVGKFVEFYGAGLGELAVPDRATIGNMAPEYGATVGFFPVDAETLAYLRFTGRPETHVALVEAYAREQGLFRMDGTPDPLFSDTIELDLSDVEPSIAGPKRPQDRVPLSRAKTAWREALASLRKPHADVDPTVIGRWLAEGGSTAAPASDKVSPVGRRAVGSDHADATRPTDGSVVIAAITSCTNTSNPQVMLAAGLLARNAVRRGLMPKPWVKTSIAPGSKVVTDYLVRSGLMPYLERLGFYLVGYGCTTCIGNSGPLPEAVVSAILSRDLVAVAVLSGNRNFEGRIHQDVRANYLASPPLVVAYALAGTMDIDMRNEPLGHDDQGHPVYLRDIWPDQAEITAAMHEHIESGMFRAEYAGIFDGDENWRALSASSEQAYAWDDHSTYIRLPPYFDTMPLEPQPQGDIVGARLLALLGDSVTTDHISPAGAIPNDSPAGRYLVQHGVMPEDFNSYGSRRGNHEVMVRGTFANLRLRNLLTPDTEGGWTEHLPDGERMSIFDAAECYRSETVPLLVIAGADYGAGSSRDWAAKGTMLLGVRAVIAQSFERIHRSNLLGMGVLPLQFEHGQDARSLGLAGRETYDIEDLDGLSPRGQLIVRARGDDGSEITFSTLCRIDTPIEAEYYRHGGILPYVMRRLFA
jgi:aconitate hydratase